MYKKRHLEETILNLSKSFKVLYLSGPRQVGKTTLLKHLSKKTKMNYVCLDNIALRTLAREDPELFLQRFSTPLLIDEVQYAPQLFPYIKIIADNSDKNGLYWLTGSQQFSIMKNVKESLAGRIGIVNLLGFSMAEKLEYPKTKRAFLPGAKPPAARALSVKSVFNFIHQGSFPALTHRNPPPLDIFYNSYLQTYIDRDLKDIFNISKISDFHKFLQLCAARTGQILNYSDLARDADISVQAAKDWINVLEASFQIYLLRPYYKNISKRMIKSPKLYFLDTGLAAYLARWKSSETLAVGAMAGAFFETFAVSEIIKSYWHRGQEAPLYYYRDKEGREVDIIIEQEGALYPVEIKAAGQARKDDLKNIEYLRKKNQDFGKGAIISLSKLNAPIDRNNDVIPIWMIS